MRLLSGGVGNRNDTVADRPGLGMLQDLAQVQEVLLRGGSLRASRLPPFVNEGSGIHGS